MIDALGGNTVARVSQNEKCSSAILGEGIGMRKAGGSSKGRFYLGGRLTRREMMALIGSGAVLAAGGMPVLSLPTHAATIRPAAIPSRSRRSGPVSNAAVTRADQTKLLSSRLGQIELSRTFLPRQSSDDGPALRPARSRQPEHLARSNNISKDEQRIGSIVFGPLRAATQAHASAISKAAMSERFSSLDRFLRETENFRGALEIFMWGELGKGGEDPASGRSVETMRRSEELREETRTRKRERDEEDRRTERLRQPTLGEHHGETRSRETLGRAGAGEWEPRQHLRVERY